VDPFLVRVPRIQPAGKDIIDDLVRGAAPGDDGAVVRRRAAGRSMTCPMVGLPAAVEAAGSRAAVGRRRAIALATLEAGGTAGNAARRTTAQLLPVVECARFRGRLVVHDG